MTPKPLTPNFDLIAGMPVGYKVAKVMTPERTLVPLQFGEFITRYQGNNNWLDTVYKTHLQVVETLEAAIVSEDRWQETKLVQRDQTDLDIVVRQTLLRENLARASGLIRQFYLTK